MSLKRGSVPDMMLALRNAVQENQELKKEISMVKEMNLMLQQERAKLFERIVALEAEVQEAKKKTGSEKGLSSSAAIEQLVSPRLYRSNDLIRSAPDRKVGEETKKPDVVEVVEDDEFKKEEVEKRDVVKKEEPEKRDVKKEEERKDAEKREASHSPRFEPLEDAPVLTRDSRRRPPPPPPQASTVVANVMSAISSPPMPTASSLPPPPAASTTKSVSPDGPSTPEPPRSFFTKSLKNTFGRSSKRPEEEESGKITLSRGSSRTPVLSRASTKPSEETPEPPPPVVTLSMSAPSSQNNSGTEMRCTIVEVNTVSDGFKKVALYNVLVVSRDGDEWRVARRYNQFLSLHAALQQKTSKTLTFPPKKFGLTMDESKMKQRQGLLQKFLDQVMEMPTLTSTVEFMRFLDPLESPSVWSLSFQDVVLESDDVVQVVALSPFNQQLERQERFLMLVQSKLFVFRDEMGVDALHTVALDYSVVDFEGQMETGRFAFSVRHLTQTQPLLFEADEVECKKWVLAIRQARQDSSSGLSFYDPSVIEKTVPAVVAADSEASLKGSAVLRRVAHGKSVRLSTFATVPDTVSSLLGSFSFSAPDSPDNVVLKEGGVVAAATIEKLIEKLTLPECNKQMIQFFLLTYRATLTPQELFAYMLARYHHADLLESRKKGPHRAGGLMRNVTHDRVIVMLEMWLDVGFQDFAEDGDLTVRLMSFVHSALEGNILMNDSAERIKATIKSRVLTSPAELEAEHEKLLEQLAPKPLLPNMLGMGMSFLIDVDPVEIARQIALLEHGLFCKIRGPELLGQKWSKESLRPLAPNVMTVIGRFNLLSAWTVHAVLQPNDAAVRAVIFSRLVAIAQQLVLMAAFGPASAIIGGLLSPAVMRLKKTAELVEIDTQNLMKELEKLIAPEKNHKHYREMLQVTLLEKKPCCPYLGLYLADLTFIEDGNPDKRGDMINFDKRCMLGKVLSEILRFQNIRYMFRPVPALQWFLSNQTPLSEKQAYDLSLTQEPRTK